jgi:long-chain acyl-CoA synthetase
LFNPSLIFNPFLGSQAIIQDGLGYTYAELLDVVNAKRSLLNENFSEPSLILLKGDFTLHGIAWLLALLAENHVVYILASNKMFDITLWQHLGINAEINSEDNRIDKFKVTSKSNAIYDLLQNRQGGLIFLSSGTSGEAKLILHSTNRLLSKYNQSKKAFTTLGFLLFDHIAGFDTLMYTLHAGGTLVTLPNRQTNTVIQHLIDYMVEVLPTTPSFISLLLFEDKFTPIFLPNLKIITFGSERMNSFTLERLLERFAHAVRCEQKYGLTELGSLVLKSKPGDPSWIKLDERFASWKVIDNELYIKTTSSLIAYIYPSYEQTCDEWFNTQDQVVVDGEWLKILGRNSDIINVGGQKVYPAEVEAVIQSMPNVLQVVVSAESHPLMGQVVKATIQLAQMENEKTFKSSLRQYCKDKLASYKVPVVVILSSSLLMTERFKAQR